MKKIKLQEGEYICDRCNGEGKVNVTVRVLSNSSDFKVYDGGTSVVRDDSIDVKNVKVICRVCSGRRKLNWVERILGKNENYEYVSMHLPLNKTMDQFAKEIYDQQAQGLAHTIDESLLNTVTQYLKTKE